MTATLFIGIFVICFISAPFIAFLEVKLKENREEEKQAAARAEREAEQRKKRRIREEEAKARAEERERKEREAAEIEAQQRAQKQAEREARAAAMAEKAAEKEARAAAMAEKAAEREARAAAAHAVKVARAKELAELAERKLAAEKELAELKKRQEETNNAVKPFQPAAQVRNIVSIEQKKAVSDLPENISSAIDSSAFEGETVTFTGTAPGFKRRDCLKIVQAAGGSAFEDINTRCTMLVICNRPGKGKQETAQKWGLNVITWAEFAERAGIAA